MYLTIENRLELAEKGFTVVKGVLSEERAAHYLERFWGWLESGAPGGQLDRHRPETWLTKNMPFRMHGGLIQHYQIGHAQFVWDLRQEPAVVQAFSELWDDCPPDDLLVSFDGGCFMLPTKNQQEADKRWPHLDQGPRKQGLQCYQGFVNLIECGPRDGGLVVYPGSHLQHAQFWERKLHDCAERGEKSPAKGDWYKFDLEKQELARYYGIALPDDEHKVCCQAGDLVLWDSRTIHHAKRPDAEKSRMRACVYTCMTPRKKANEKALQKKVQLFKAHRMSNHWPHAPKMFGVKSHLDRAEVPFCPGETNSYPRLSPLGKRLAGFRDEQHYAEEILGLAPSGKKQRTLEEMGMSKT